MKKSLAIALALITPALTFAVPTILPLFQTSGTALVDCPPSDATGCDNIMATVSNAERAYDGSNSTVDLRSADLSSYKVLIIPSLADDSDNQPYALLRDAAVAANLRKSLMGRRVFWSGAPDLGSENREAKNGLLGRLVSYASSNFDQAAAPGLVVLLDRSSANR